ncbi:MAG TPA: 3-methyl-2-oxobutanoate hydroxymethyltransferase [Candidatus Angelobacter sp.]|jgi:3-methyl-2-oxobutanoate hydroxymethyltransferase
MSITSFNGGQPLDAQPNPDQSGSDQLKTVWPKVTTTTIQDKKQRRERITCLTAYDYSNARLVDEAGIDMILVGDSLAQVVLGYESTLPVTMDEMLHHTRAVRRAVKSAMVIADMPYGTYHLDIKDGVQNAVRFVKESGAEAVKLEGGAQRVELVKRVLDAEVPVMAHIGLTPQSLHKMGGYKVQGKDFAGIERLVKDAVALDQAGVFAIVLEGVPREVAAMITREVTAPTIGIGAGPDCDGQVLVFHDILNLTFAEPAKFVRRYGDAKALITAAVQHFRADVINGQYPSDEESYHLPKHTKAELEAILRRKEMKAYSR